MVIHILQRNARSLIANGQKFEQVVADLKVAPDVICVRVTWLRLHLDFVIPGYILLDMTEVTNKVGDVLHSLRIL